MVKTVFKLSIECSKDISELHINFADGTSAVVENTPSETPETPEKNSTIPNALKKNTPKVSRTTKPFTPIDMSETQVNQDKVKLPDIQPISRPVKVADELQNLDI